MIAAVPLVFALLTGDTGLTASADGGAVNAPLPAPKDKTTAPRSVDPAGNPRPQDQSALPKELSDIPYVPPQGTTAPAAAPPPPATTPSNAKPPAGGGAQRGGEIKE